jgi:hypothetical protein
MEAYEAAAAHNEPLLKDVAAAEVRPGPLHANRLGRLFCGELLGWRWISAVCKLLLLLLGSLLQAAAATSSCL